MLTRLTHAAIAFAITVVVYQAYVLLAAPLVEPPQTEKLSLTASDQELKATHKYRELLAAYFPPNHWTLTEPPITAENGQAMVVIDAFNPRDDGQVRVKKCVILFFPSGRVAGEPAPRDVVVLEAPHGAVLQMDKSLKRGISSLGRLQWGKFNGQITVRSDMREAGPQDDLILVTRDLQLTEDLIYTKDVVDMQLGLHRGHGRELEIRLVAIERGRASSSGPNLGGIDSIEILHEVKAELSPGAVQLGSFAASSESTPNTLPPVQITSGGRFRFDFPKQIASFAGKVLLEQQYSQGMLDELRCEELALYLAKDHATDPGHDRATHLSLGSIIARGTPDTPVELDSQSQQATVRCGRMWIKPGTRQINFDQGHKVELTYQGHELHAKQVQYTAPSKNSTHRVGDFHASGSGWLRALTSDQPDAEPFEVRWSENMLLRRTPDGQALLSLNGRPLLDMVGMGRLWADHLDLYLRESATDGSEADLLPADIVPQRLVAGGEIAIDSAQLHGKVKQLEVRFDYAPSGLLLTGPTGDNSQATRRQLGRRNFGKRGSTLKRTYDISGQLLEMLVTVRQKEPEITSIDVDGQVVFNESSAPNAATSTTNKQPLRVVADHLRVENADSPSATIEFHGKPATITAGGMSIRTENLQIERGTNQAWVEAPGQIEMFIDRDLSGQRLAAPQLLTIYWQQGMNLNRDLITFRGNVQVQTTGGTLDTQQLAVKLSAPVQFDGAAKQPPHEIAQLSCSRGVNAMFSQRDSLGLASVQTLQLEESFLVDMQTGEVRGNGPGQMESVHLSQGNNPIGELANRNTQNRGGRGRLASTSPPQTTSTAQRLRFLGVKFVRGVQGNINRRQVKIYGDVEAVYGPVDAWEQRLALTKSGMPGPDTIWINCQSLSVAESPLARLSRQASGLGPLELQAAGNVTIEGPAGERGNFTTRSQRANYDQLKKTFILEGTSAQPASISIQQFRGGPTSPTQARKITYYQETGNVDVDGLVSGQFRQTAPGR